ncbi:MAG: hypothetical protein ACK41D_03360 [Rubricoccaceae bacterium]
MASNNNSGAMTAIVAIVAILAVLFVIYFFFLRGGGTLDGGGRDINVEINPGGATESVTPN